jgi:methionine-rich copper-binding protein CopC
MTLYPADTATIKATVKSKTGTKIDASSHEIKVYDPDDSLQDTYTNPVHDALGEYHLDFLIPVDGKAGTWKVVWKATTAEGTKTELITFDVFKTLAS